MLSQFNDQFFMLRALRLAELGGVNVAPNPLVGAVIVNEGKIIGEGYHQFYGKEHAEVNAVNNVNDKSLLKTSTIYITLEPCAHHGKTPPCADLLVHHKFKRVVIACSDSFSEVSGKGIERLKSAGIDVTIGVLEQEARFLNRRFFCFHEKKRPYIFLKWAKSSDGFIDKLRDKSDRTINWVTEPSTKLYVHKWRSTEQAILVGWKTIKVDNPQLNVREISAPSPHRFIIDPTCNTPLNSHVILDGGKTTFIVRTNNFPDLPSNIKIICINNFSIKNILNEIHSLNITSIFVEGGAFTHEMFIQSNLWDEALVLEGKRDFLAGIQAPRLNKKPFSVDLIGSDKLYHYFNT